MSGAAPHPRPSGDLEDEVKLDFSDCPISLLQLEQFCFIWFCMLGFLRTQSQIDLQPFEGQEGTSSGNWGPLLHRWVSI